MLADAFDWHVETAGAFDPAIGRLLDAWDVHGDGSIPDAAILARARAAAGLAHLSFDRRGCTVTRTADVTLDVGAFGKGEALDRVEAALGSDPWMIDLGGQVSVGGAAPRDGAWSIAIAHPRARDRPYVHVRLRNGSLATSAGSERDLTVRHARVGHILDPRTGTPAAFSGSVSVWHRRGLAADILSTALYVMGPEAGLRWAEDRGLAVCYLIPAEDGRVRMLTTRAFATLLVPTSHRDTESQR
jgi:thiamine biosynthesis lipoprotein